MANIPGLAGYSQPGTFSRVRTIRRGVSIPGGLRILAVIGLGQAEETVVLSAEGGGADGVNPNFAGSSAPDGRHFVLSKTNLIPNRTSLFLNGIPLTGTEETIDTDPFNSKYDFRMEPSTGRVELQRASLVDQGGELAPPGDANVGNGEMSTIELIDANAPTETWTFRATSVIRDAYGDPVPDVTVFTAVGSESGQPVDAYGAPVVFISDGEVRDNGILRVAITEGAVAFDRNDRFTVRVSSKVLVEGDELEARYIATADLLDPEFFVDSNKLYAKHGTPSATNTLSLGSEMAFENGAFGVLALQTRPPVPRRLSEVLLESDDPLSTTTEGFPSLGLPVTSADIDSFRYTLDGGTPDTDTSVNIFVLDRDDGSETQIFPTKIAFYDSGITADPYNGFIDNPNFTFSYTVILDGEVEDEGNDGETVAGQFTFQAQSAQFAAFNLDVGESLEATKKIRILSRDRFGDDASDVAGEYTITAVGDGTGDDSIVTLASAALTASGGWTATLEDLQWELVDEADSSARLLLTTDLFTNGTVRTRDGLKATYIDIDDADFFDTNWAAALEKLEAVDCQMVVPLPDSTFSAIQQATVAHCELMSNTANQRERVALLGAQQGVTNAALAGRELVAVEDVGVIEGIQGDDPEEVLADNIEDLQDFDVSTNYGTTFRAMYFWPDEIVRVINGTQTTLHGFYLAAAAGGLLAATPNVAQPLTRKILTGFSILRSKILRPLLLNELGDNGVAVVQPVTGGGQIQHGKTTTSSGAAEEEELSIVFIRDRTATVLREVLRTFIGQPEDPTLVASITSMVTKTLQALMAQGLLTQFQNLNVGRDDVEPRQWNVSVEVQPVFPVNWIFIDISVGIL
jgi:hypothetical protein